MNALLVAVIDLVFIFGTIHFFRLSGMWAQYALDTGIDLMFCEHWGYSILGVLCFIGARITAQWGDK